MNQPGNELIVEAILGRAQEGIDEASRRCTEAAAHLESGSYQGALGALAGLEERVHYVTTILCIAQDLEQAESKN